MNTYLILRRKGWRDVDELEKAAGRSGRVGNQEMVSQVRWMRSYVLGEDDGGLGTVCIYEAVNAEAIAEHARRAGLPCDAVIPVVQTVIINEDAARSAA